MITWFLAFIIVFVLGFSTRPAADIFSPGMHRSVFSRKQHIHNMFLTNLVGLLLHLLRSALGGSLLHGYIIPGRGPPYTLAQIEYPLYPNGETLTSTRATLLPIPPYPWVNACCA